MVIKKKNASMGSIRKQFSLIYIGLMAGTVFLCLIINNIFLGKYYISSKIEVIQDAYKTIAQAASNDSYDTLDFQEELGAVCNRYNITVCVIDANSRTRYVSQNGGRELEGRLIGYIFGFPGESARVIEEGPDYRIQHTGTANEGYLEMYGRLNSGISFIMRTPIESIQESAKIANRFFAYVGIMGTIAGGIIIWFVSRKITKPILELNNISERMVHLDFEAKYRVNAQNEIDLLGENINKLSESLEKSISELKTANNELQKDIERKEQIDEMRKEFLANVSHELKTPIALIQGYAEGLKEEINEDSENREYYCEVIMDEASKMNSMVKKLLTLNQLEFGTDVVDFERFDVVALVRNYLQSVEILARQQDVTVKVDACDAIYVWADEFKTEEVFMNYFINALNHCQGDKVVEVKFQKRKGKVRISVLNTGVPIPEEALPYIWDKFYKIDQARTREYGGSGVGLSIVKAIMEIMNQQYGVENSKEGVCFWFELETVQAQ